MNANFLVLTLRFNLQVISRFQVMLCQKSCFTLATGTTSLFESNPHCVFVLRGHKEGGAEQQGRDPAALGQRGQGRIRTRMAGRRALNDGNKNQ